MKKINLDKISTEEISSNFKELDLKNIKEILSIINEEDAKISKSINLKIPEITLAVELIVETIKAKGRVFYLGAGTSGRLGVLDASEILPTYGADNLFYGIIAGGDEALRNPIEGAEDSETLSVEELMKKNLSPNDLVFAIGASGRTPYCISALKYAKEIGSKTIALSMCHNSEFKNYAKINIEILVGPEVIAGSTRMKSGTATKMVLNMISSATMIKLGKVYDNLMIDLKATNEKLLNRAIKIIKTITNINNEEYLLEILVSAKMETKTAIVMIKNNVSYSKAKEQLDFTNQNLRKALDN